MQILISCAKTMADSTPAPRAATTPAFADDAAHTVRRLQTFDAEELQTVLHVPARIAAENVLRYGHFFDTTQPALPALQAYTGIVFKYIRPEDFTDEDFAYAQRHLFITSFLYGLLRPLDGIRPYRLEGNVRLPDEDGPSRFEHWQPRLTDLLIRAVKADDGILVNLASAEMKRLFNWRRVCRETQVVTPEFRTMQEGRLRSVVVHAKMCRGQMTRFILKNRPVSVEELRLFEPDIDAPVTMELK